MTLSTLTSRVSYPGAGSAGPFAYPFRIARNEDLLVTKRSTTGVESPLTLGIDYTVTGARSASGTVTLTTALAVGETVVIRRAPALTQSTSITNQGPGFSRTIEDEFDTLVMQLQSLKDEIDRSLKLSETNAVSGFNVILPNPDAGKVLGGTGTGFSMVTLDSSAVAIPGQGRAVSTLSAYLANNSVFNVRDFNTGAGSDTSYAQAAVAAAKTYGGTGAYVTWQGNLNIVDTLTVDANALHFAGLGKRASTITFTPASAKPLFKVQAANPTQLIYDVTFRNFGLFGSGAQQKIGFDLWDSSSCIIENVEVFANWTGNSGSSSTPSIALRTNGRESLTVSNAIFFADRPIHIRVNPNSASLSADHFHFTDLYFSTQIATEDGILIDANCVVSNLTFDGRQAWVGGKNGLRFVGGGAAAASLVATFKGIRYEQGQDITGYAFRWEPPSCQNLKLEDCYFGGLSNRGAYIRNTNRITFDNCLYAGQVGYVFVDIDSTCDAIWFRDTFAQDLTVANLAGLELVWSLPKRNSNSPVPPTAYYCSTATGNIGVMVGSNRVYTYSAQIAAAGTMSLPGPAVGSGMKVAIVSVAGYSATGPINEYGDVVDFQNAAFLKAGNSANFALGNVAAKLNYDHNAGAPLIRNNTAQTLDVLVTVTWKT